MVFIAHIISLKKQKSRLLARRLRVMNNFEGGTLLIFLTDIDSKINALNEQINWNLYNNNFTINLN
jgi:hypothetical protein